jgi:MarR-like DNA-binding transcriptional regulator SgrR of sgrS sRNA
LESNLHFPRGRPYLDRIKVLAGTRRNALRIFSLKEAEILLGQSSEGSHPEAPPALFATYLAFSPAKVGDGFRSAFESSLDRTNLAQFFARGSSVPMQSLLPPDLMSQAQSSAGPKPMAPPAHPLTLLYDSSLPEQRSVAERVQVKLHDRGYRISLKGLARSELRARWASGQFDLMLHGLLLPPQPAAALAVVIDAAGRHDLLSTELPPLGAESDRVRRDARARERAMALANQLHLIPLYAQSISISFAPQLKNLAFDAYGLPEMENAFFSGAGG